MAARPFAVACPCAFPVQRAGPAAQARSGPPQRVALRRCIGAGRCHHGALALEAAAPLHAEFPHGLRAELAVTVAPDQLRIALSATNTGSSALAFTGALHTYLAVQGADIAALQGLEGAAFWDAAKAFSPAVQSGAVALGEEVDRVYARSAQPLELRDAAGTLQIGQDATWPETVVSNPGPALCATLPDMQGADWMRMLCVEAAAINQPVALHPGQHWQAAQTLQVIA